MLNLVDFDADDFQYFADRQIEEILMSGNKETVLLKEKNGCYNNK